jgi:hypothetical protein
MIGKHDLLIALHLDTGKGMELLARRVGDVLHRPILRAFVGDPPLSLWR